MLLAFEAEAQIIDSFSNQDSFFAQWSGSTHNFKIENGQLKSASIVPNDTFRIIRLANQFEEWTLDLRFEFNTSSANYVHWILYEKEDLSYYILCGGTKDEFSLIRSDKHGDTMLIDGLNKTSEKVAVRLKVTFIDSIWTLRRIYPDSSIVEGEATDNFTPSSSALTGIFIKQSTSSFFGKHYFDKLYVGHIRKDTSAPILDSVILSQNKVTLYFDETIKFSDSLILLHSNPIVQSASIDHKLLTLLLKPLENGEYNLYLTGLSDQSGNTIANSLITLKIFNGTSPTKGEIIFNEILFNPYPDSYDFIELYNRSEKVIDLDSSILFRSVDGERKNAVILPHYLMLPGTYLVLTEDSTNIQEIYASSGMRFLEIDIPPMNNDDGTLVILGKKGKQIDSLIYDQDMHFEFLNSREGVSLERITFEDSSFNPLIWHSAASTAGYATPGSINSQYFQSRHGSLQLQSSTVSPNSDGYQDQLILNYDFPKPGFVLQLRIFDETGRFVDRPANQETMATAGIFSWDMVLSNGTILLPGRYILYLEAFHADGMLVRKKFAFVVY